MKILLVDDSVTELGRIKQIVEKAGHDVVVAKDGLEAIEKAKEELPDMIFAKVPDLIFCFFLFFVFCFPYCTVPAVVSSGASAHKCVKVF